MWWEKLLLQVLRFLELLGSFKLGSRDADLQNAASEAANDAATARSFQSGFQRYISLHPADLAGRLRERIAARKSV